MRPGALKRRHASRLRSLQRQSRATGESGQMCGACPGKCIAPRLQRAEMRSRIGHMRRTISFDGLAHLKRIDTWFAGSGLQSSAWGSFSAAIEARTLRMNDDPIFANQGRSDVMKDDPMNANRGRSDVRE